MKKKVLLILLCGVCLLGITGCGNGKEKETGKKDNQNVDVSQMKKEAVDVDLKQVLSESKNNEVRAKKSYVGKVYKFTTIIDMIQSDYVNGKVCYKGDDDCQVYGVADIYMSEDEISKLNVGDTVTIIGKITEVSEFPSATIKNAFVVE